MLASVWHTIWSNVFWTAGGGNPIRAISIDAILLALLVGLLSKARGKLRKRGN